MATFSYPLGGLDGLLRSPLVTATTRQALTGRLQTPLPPWPEQFTEAERATLAAVCARLLPPDSPLPADSAARRLAVRLVSGPGDGWRYDALPPDLEACLRGLRGLDETAAQGTTAADTPLFSSLAADHQEAILQAVAQDKAEGETWRTLNGKRFFEELLAALTELYASHPTVQEGMGYTGFADAAGWQRIGLDERETWETPAHKEARRSPLPSPAPRREAVPELPDPQRFREDEVVDAVIIGTGAGGGPLLWRLARAGLKVVALEAGRAWHPARDFATDEVAQEPLFWTDERLSAGANPLAFGNNNSGIGVGGSTLHYTAYTPRPQPDDFRLRTESGVGCDWPLAYEDLEGYFDELETFLGISGPSPYPWGPARKKGYPLAPLSLNGAAQLMARGAARLGLTTSPAPNAALSAPYYQPGIGWRPACTNRGFCQAGCSVGAKASVDVTFIPAAFGLGAEVRAEMFVTGFERDGQGRMKAVIYKTKDGREARQLCRNVFLCAGAIETPRLLLRAGLANGSGQVGRNFMAHTGIQVWGQFDEEIRPWKGIPGGLISEDTHRPKDADFAGGYLLQSIGVMPVTYAVQRARSDQPLHGAALGEHLKQYNHVAGINILGECLPSEENFVALSDEKDARGLPKPRVSFSAGDNETKLTAHAERTMRAIWEGAGGREPWSFQRFAHTIGTCRMGTDAGNSVVDRNGRVWDVPGLYLCDNSVFPSSLAVNPALTIMAVSLRTADQFLKKSNERKTRLSYPHQTEVRRR